MKRIDMEIKVNKIYKAYGTIVVLKSISLSIEKGQKIGLIGYNGTGKTTLLKIIAGLVEPDSGDIAIRKGLSISYVPQDTSLVSDETIREYICRTSGMTMLEKEMKTSGDAVSEYKHRGGYTFHYRLDVMLAGFGLRDISNDSSVNTLSSGQRSKVFMIGALLSEPDVLLLDEPTNNLDLPALIWLEGFLVHSDITRIIVSHDRVFLNRVANKIFEIDWYTRMLNGTSGTYSDYVVRKEKERARQWVQYKAQQNEIERLTEQARKKKQEAIAGSHYKGTDNDKSLINFKRENASRSAKRAKAIEKRIEHMEIVEKPNERDLFRIRLAPTKPRGTRDIVLTNTVAGYASSKFKIGPISLTIPYGRRVVIFGPNGIGKTTLLKTIIGKLPALSGEVVRGGALVVGNLMQEHEDLPREESIKDFLMRRAKITIQDMYALVAKSGFRASEINKKIGSLSPGGRARLLFALFSTFCVNVLVLDEPTNHLDLEALEALEEAVGHYDGTIILVSHDRYFLEKFNSTDRYVLSDGKLVRQESFETYINAIEKEAKNLIEGAL